MRAQQEQGDEQRDRDPVRRPPRLKKPLLSGFSFCPPTSSGGALSLLAMAARLDWSDDLGRSLRRTGSVSGETWARAHPLRSDPPQ